MRHSLALLALSSVLALTSVACVGADESEAPASSEAAASAARPRTVTASSNAGFAQLEGLWSVQTAEAADGVMLRAYELGGGDPAMNGTSVYLAASFEHDTAIWDLGVDIRSITKIESTGAGALKLVGTRDNLDADGMPVSEPFEMIARYRLADDGLGRKLSVQSDGEAREIVASSDAALELVSSVYDVKTSEHGDVHARVFETGGGDPAMNGDQLYLTLMVFPETKTFDLGLDVASVTKVTTMDREVRIEGAEDVMDRDGNITQQPFTYAIKYAVEDYAPSNTVTVAKIR